MPRNTRFSVVALFMISSTSLFAGEENVLSIESVQGYVRADAIGADCDDYVTDSAFQPIASLTHLPASAEADAPTYWNFGHAEVGIDIDIETNRLQMSLGTQAYTGQLIGCYGSMGQGDGELSVRFTLSQNSEVDLYFHAICAGGANLDEWSVRDIEIVRDATGELMFEEVHLGSGYESGSDLLTFEAGTYTATALIHAYGENGAGSDASVFLEIAPTPIEETDPADLDGNGQVDGNDLIILLGAWGTSDAAADLDGNGIVDGADLMILLGAWGA